MILPDFHGDGPGCCGKCPFSKGVNSYPNPFLLHISHCFHSNLFLTMWRWFRNFSLPSDLPLLLRTCSCALVLQEVPLASLSWLLMDTIPLQATNSFYNVSTNKITIKDYNTCNKKWQGREEKWQGRGGSHTLLTVSMPISALPKFLPSPLEILIQHRITSCKITSSYPQPPLLYLPHSSCKALKEFLPTGLSRFTRVIDVGDFWM